MRRALVTGSSNGLGRAIGEKLLAKGWHVTGVDVAETGDKVEPCLEFLRCDLSDRTAVDALTARLCEGATFDLVVLNAGVSATGRFEKIPLAAHLRLLRINAEAPLVLSAGLVAGRAIGEGGAIVFVSSLSHFVKYPGAASYASSKDAVAVYAKSVRRPFARRGISVTLACPGPMRTGHAERHAPEGARADRRMPAETAAAIILAAAFKSRKLVVPGFGNAAAGWAGHLAPIVTARAMRRMIFEKLDRETW